MARFWQIFGQTQIAARPVFHTNKPEPAVGRCGQVLHLAALIYGLWEMPLLFHTRWQGLTVMNKALVVCENQCSPLGIHKFCRSTIIISS
jgi:hypothetical protein